MEPVTTAAALTAGAGLIGNFLQQGAENSAATKNRDFQRSEAKRNRDFQERMSSTAYQRSTEDMRKAGLNPMLAFSQGGASTPSGSAGSGAQAKGINPMEGVVASALEARRLKKEIAVADAQEKQIKEQTKKTKEEKKTIEYQNEGMKQDAKFYEQNEWYRKASRYLELFGLGANSAASIGKLRTPKLNPKGPGTKRPGRKPLH